MPRRAVDGGPRLRSLNLKTTETLRSKIEDAARLSGRSLTQEVERRLELSFDEERFAATVQSAVERGLTIRWGS